MIEFINVSHEYRKHKQRIRVLENISLQIKPGEFIILTGVSGAGKTTLLKLLIGEERPIRGRIIVDGQDIIRMNPSLLQYYRRRVGMIFQDYRLLKTRTVFENVAFALEVCGANKEEIKMVVPQVLELVNLKGKENQFPWQLSGGEAQRTALARALVHSPQLLLADEPTGNLDSLNSKEVIDTLLEIHKLGQTVILATHDEQLVDSIRGRKLVLQDGGILERFVAHPAHQN